jgi:hypothetical protein
MKKKIICLVVSASCILTSHAQSLAINTDGSTANSSALLDVKSTTKGLLIPRMDSLQRAAIATPATGLLVYQTNKDTGFYHFDGTGWQQLIYTKNNLWKRNGSHIYNSNTGNVGIGIINPLAKLHVVDSSVVFSAAENIPFPQGNVPISGEGRRMMWYVDKAAFRVGYVFGANWDKDSIGRYSFAAGVDVKAKGESSTAFGTSTIAYGLNATAFGDGSTAGFRSTAFGYNSNANGANSTAFGNNAVANGIGSTAFGNNSVANGNYAISAGYNSIANGNYASSIGQTTLASGDYAFAFGSGTSAFGNYSTSFGQGSSAAGLYAFSSGTVSQANGEASTAFGFNGFAAGDYSFAAGKSTVAKAIGGVALGANNDNSDTPSSTANPMDRIFQIGNGSSAVSRSNAITVLRNGAVGIGVTNPNFRLAVDGDGAFYGFINALNGLNTAGTLSAGNTNITGSINVAALATLAALRITLNASPGRVLTSDATGNANWADAINYWTLSGGDLYNNNTGNTGIGITDPAFKLDVGARMRIRSTAGNTAGLWLNNDANNALPAFIGIQNDSLVGFYGSAVPYNGWGILMNTNNGRVGIGTDNPNKQTEIIGAASATPVTLVIGNRGGFGPAAMEFVSDYGLANQWRPGYIRSNDIGGFTGAVEVYTNGTGAGNLYGSVKGLEVRNGVTYTATGTVGTFSDERIKNNVQPFTSGLDIINQINPVSFYYNQQSPFKTDKMQIGILAQELERVAPYMIDKNVTKEFDDLRSVNNQAYIFLLINAVKELQAEIEVLKNKK